MSPSGPAEAAPAAAPLLPHALLCLRPTAVCHGQLPWKKNTFPQICERSIAACTSLRCGTTAVSPGKDEAMLGLTYGVSVIPAVTRVLQQSGAGYSASRVQLMQGNQGTKRLRALQGRTSWRKWQSDRSTLEPKKNVSYF